LRYALELDRDEDSKRGEPQVVPPFCIKVKRAAYLLMTQSMTALILRFFALPSEVLL